MSLTTSPQTSSYLKFPTFPKSLKITTDSILTKEDSINTCVKHLLQLRINPNKYTFNRQHLQSEILSHFAKDNHYILQTIVLKNICQNMELLIASLFSEESFLDLKAQFLLKYPQLILKPAKKAIKPAIHSCCKQCCKCGRSFSEQVPIHEELLEINMLDKLMEIFSKVYYTLAEGFSDFQDLFKKSEFNLNFRNIIQEELFLIVQNKHDWFKFAIYKINSLIKCNSSTKFSFLAKFTTEFTSIIPLELDKFLNFINQHIMDISHSSSSVDDIIEYINNTDCSKHSKKKKHQKKKKNCERQMNNKDDDEINPSLAYDLEVEEFKAFLSEIYFTTHKSQTERKISPHFSDQWLVSIQGKSRHLPIKN
jgi:hypothetical protein